MDDEQFDRDTINENHMRIVNTPITPESEPEIWAKAHAKRGACQICGSDREGLDITHVCGRCVDRDRERAEAAIATERSNLAAFPDCELYWMEQRTDEWFEVRRGCLTATGMGPWLLGSNKTAQKARQTAICRCLSEIGNCYELPIRENDAMKRGTDLEPLAVAHFEHQTGHTVHPVGFAKSIHGRFGCSPDGILDGASAGFEGKCPTGAKHFEYVLAGELPDAYRWQVLGSMAVTGARSWWFQSFHPGQPSHIMVIDRTDEVDELREALVAFSLQLDERIAEMAELWEAQK